VRGLNSKLSSIFIKSADLEFDIIALTETWLRDTVLDSEVFCQEYHVHRKDRTDRRGGGVLLAIKSSLHFEPICDALFDDIEFVCVKVFLPGKILFLTCSYVPPNCDSNTYVLHSRAIRNVADRLNCSDLLLVCGDFSLPHISWDYSSDSWRCALLSDSNDFLNELVDLSLNQVNKIPNSNGRLLDLIFVNDNTFSPVSRGFPITMPEDLHHPSLELSIETTSSSSLRANCSSDRNMVFCYHKANFELMKTMLASVDWANLFLNLGIDECVEALYNVIWECIHHCVPLIVDKNLYRPPWESPLLKKLKNAKNRLFKKYKRSGTLLSYAQYAEARYRYFKCNKDCYAAYLRRLKARIQADPKKFFDFVNVKRKSSGFPSQFTLDDKSSTSDFITADLFADFFSSVYTNDSFDQSNFRSEIPRLSTVLSPLVVDENTVFAYLKTLKVSYKGGSDGIPSVLMKTCADELSEPLSLIFNVSLSSGIFPALWKESYVIPLHKSGPKSNIRNYRGIAKLSVIPKLFEHIISDQLNPLLQPIISSAQHGFVKNRSTTTNLLEFTNLISDGFADGLQTDVCYTDATKAFDRLCHAILCYKLDKIGLPPVLVKWIESYLIGRSQRVLFKNITSKRFEVTSGVPQGSHLGPLLFNLFINDLPSVLQHCSVFMFADDVKICHSYNNPADQDLMQLDLDRFSNWCEQNCLMLNISKCKVMSFSWRREAIACSYYLNGVHIENVTEMRDLGVIMDPKLKFVVHINAVVCKARSMLAFIKRWSKEFNDPYITKLLYTSLVRPHLEYASPVWNPSYSVHSDSIESVQKQFLLFALRALPWDPAMNLPSYESRLKLISLPTLKSRRVCANICFLFKLINGIIDSPSLLGRIEFNVPNRPQRYFEPIRLKTRRVNYLDFEAFRTMCKDYNCYYFLICYSHSVDSLKFSLLQHMNM